VEAFELLNDIRVKRTDQPLPEPLLSLLFYFLTRMPQSYIDLLLPLLDQDPENPSRACPTRAKRGESLTVEQALAFDLYAHWSVLMFMVEDECWWIGNLPIMTLGRIIDQYGDDFKRILRLREGLEPYPWWPESMLNIAGDQAMSIKLIAHVAACACSACQPSLTGSRATLT
jgi:hypothetical protein